MDEYLEKNSLEPRRNFTFPFEPYSIQQEFMSSLYSVIENKQLGIFESPTGTGKSLSIICGSLCWLKDHEERIVNDIKSTLRKLDIKKSEVEISANNDWLENQIEVRKIIEFQKELHAQLEYIEKFNKDISTLKKSASSNRLRDTNLLAIHPERKPDEPVNDVLLKEFNKCDKEEDEPDKDDSVDEEVEENTYKQTKIYFCSRTHSQLSQFITEVRNCPFKDAVNLVILASRKNYCVNPTVRNLASLSLINERCIEMKKTKTTEQITSVDKSQKTVKKRKSSTKCPYNNKESILLLGKELLANMYDIEEIVTKGRQLTACPYYAARLALHLAQLIVIPYNTILHKTTREASKIDLKNNVVIIDEAHNLLDAVGNIYSTYVTGNQLCKCYDLLTQYKLRYKKLLSSSNLLHVSQLIHIVGRFICSIGGKVGCHPNEKVPGNSKIFTLPDFLCNAEIDHFNLYEIINFCEQSKIAFKLQGFGTCDSDLNSEEDNTANRNSNLKNVQNFLRQLENKVNKKKQATGEGSQNNNSRTEVKQQQQQSSTSVHNDSRAFIFPVLSFIESLNNHSEDGRILCNESKTVAESSLKFLLLNPAAHFKDIVEEARSVIVAGGTMQPISEFRTQLFENAGADPSRIVHFSYDHVVPPENILPVVLTRGPSGKELNYSYQMRNTTDMLNELAVTLSNFCNVIPAGIVCFFPSYEYEEFVYQHFRKNGILEKLGKKKKIFREPKDSGGVDLILNQYSSTIKSCLNNSTGTINGCLMLSVIGGKLSEGLNFSDDLGRAVIIIGLPYPNKASVELQEKMKYLDKTVGNGSGQIHYRNLCMKAVNQSIGRAVRHKSDYATIILMDSRYSESRILECLPSWIMKSLKVSDKFGATFAAITKFFSSRRK